MKITTLQQLYRAAIERKAVIGNDRFFNRGPKAAAWVFQMKPYDIMRLMESGIETYKSPKKKQPNHTN